MTITLRDSMTDRPVRMYTLKARDEDDTVTWHVLIHMVDEDPRDFFRQYMTRREFETYTVEGIVNVRTGEVDYPQPSEAPDAVE